MPWPPGDGGSVHPKWKGDDAGYNAVHIWMNSNYPRVGRCEWCGRTDVQTEYARTDHATCSRNRADWLELCKRCHAAFDGKGRW